MVCPVRERSGDDASSRSEVHGAEFRPCVVTDRPLSSVTAFEAKVSTRSFPVSPRAPGRRRTRGRSTTMRSSEPSRQLGRQGSACRPAVGHLCPEAAARLPAREARGGGGARGVRLTYSIVRPTAFFKSLSGQVERVRRGKPFLVFGDGGLTACKPISDDDLGRYLARCLRDRSLHDRILPVGGPAMRSPTPAGRDPL